MDSANGVEKKLFIDEADTLKELEKLVDSASQVFQIERPSAKVAFRNFRNLTDKQRIAALLSAKYLAAKFHIITDHTLSIGDLGKELGRPVTSLSGPVRQLIKEGFVESLPNRKYSIVHHRLAELFENVFGINEMKKG